VARGTSGLRCALNDLQQVIRWSRLGVFNKIFAELAGKGPKPERLMIDATHLKAHRRAVSLPKRGGSATYRVHQRRPVLQAPRHLRWPEPPLDHVTQRRPDERLQGRDSVDRRYAQGQDPARRPRLRRRLVQPGPQLPRHHALHPFKGRSQGQDRSRRRPPLTVSQDRDHVRTPQGLTVQPHTPRPLPTTVAPTP